MLHLPGWLHTGIHQSFWNALLPCTTQDPRGLTYEPYTLAPLAQTLTALQLSDTNSLPLLLSVTECTNIQSLALQHIHGVAGTPEMVVQLACSLPVLQELHLYNIQSPELQRVSVLGVFWAAQAQLLEGGGCAVAGCVLGWWGCCSTRAFPAAHTPDAGSDVNKQHLVCMLLHCVLGVQLATADWHVPPGRLSAVSDRLLLTPADKAGHA